MPLSLPKFIAANPITQSILNPRFPSYATSQPLVPAGTCLVSWSTRGSTPLNPAPLPSPPVPAAACRYVLGFMEHQGLVRRGDRVWQIGFGSGFKCNSAVWKALNTVRGGGRPGRQGGGARTGHVRALVY